MRKLILLPLILFCALTLLACSPGPTAASPTLVPPASPPPTSAAVAATPSLPTPVPIGARASARPTLTATRPSRHAAIQTPGWFQNAILYEIFVRSFADSNGDGIGDLKGITEKLDYLKDLHVGAIWLTPIFASPSYHGYDITDYYAINPDFGTEQDLVMLVQEAHKRGIRILLDYVVAHTSNQHPFFKDAYGNLKSKYANWYRWTNPAHTQYETFAAVLEMPQLNQDNSDTQKYLIDVAKYWMTKTGNGDPKLGIDGLRCDYVLNVPHDFWKNLRSELKPLNSDFVLLAEAWTGALQIDPYYDSEFDASFDFPVYMEIEGDKDKVGDSMLLGVKSPSLLEGDYNAEAVLYAPGAEHVEFINNHDTNRAMSEVKGDAARAKLGALLMLTGPYTPMIYYGEEIGMSGTVLPAPDGDKGRREPMDWFAAESGAGMTNWWKPPARNNKPNDGISVEEEQGKADSLLEFYRQLAELRASNGAFRTGSREGIAQSNPNVYAYLRRDGNEAFLIALNFGNSPASLALDLSLTSLPDGDYRAVDALTGTERVVESLIVKLDLGPALGTVVHLTKR